MSLIRLLGALGNGDVPLSLGGEVDALQFVWHGLLDSGE